MRMLLCHPFARLETVRRLAQARSENSSIKSRYLARNHSKKPFSITIPRIQHIYLAHQHPRYLHSICKLMSEETLFPSFFTPPDSIRYTRAFYDTITLANAAKEEEVHILPKGSLISFDYCRDTLSSASIALEPHESAFIRSDIDKISTAELRKKFDEGYRSVRITYRLPGVREPESKVIHFARVSVTITSFLSV